jgi:hypothetical protein
MKYGQVEEAVIRQFEVDDRRLGAFKARIRHLRRFDCPSIAKSKSGGAADYSRLNAFELAIALALENVGLSPKQSAAHAFLMAPEALGALERSGKACYLVLLPDVDDPALSPGEAGGQSIICEGEKELMGVIENMPAMGVVNVSMLVRDLDLALQARPVA